MDDNEDTYTANDIDESREFTVRAAEHEAFLSFNSDRMSEFFYEWWDLEGRNAFLKYANRELRHRGE